MVVRRRILGLVAAEVGHEVAAQDETAAWQDVASSHRVCLSDCRVAAYFERAGVGGKGAERVGVAIKDGEFPNGIVESAEPADLVVGENARHGGIHRHVTPGQRIGVQPLPERLGTVPGRGDGARFRLDGRLQVLDLGAECR